MQLHVKRPLRCGQTRWYQVRNGSVRAARPATGERPLRPTAGVHEPTGRSKLEVVVDGQRRVVAEALRHVYLLPSAERGKARGRQVVVDAARNLQGASHRKKSLAETPRPWDSMTVSGLRESRLRHSDFGVVPSANSGHSASSPKADARAHGAADDTRTCVACLLKQDERAPVLLFSWAHPRARDGRATRWRRPPRALP